MDTQIFSVQAISQSSSNSLILKGFICLECHMIIVSVELRKGNCRNGRNVATVLRAMVKSHNHLKGTKYLSVGFLEEISTFLQERTCAEVLLL